MIYFCLTINVGQGLMSHSTQFRSFRRSDDRTSSVKALKEGG